MPKYSRTNLHPTIGHVIVMHFYTETCTHSNFTVTQKYFVTEVGEISNSKSYVTGTVRAKYWIGDFNIELEGFRSLIA